MPKNEFMRSETWELVERRLGAAAFLWEPLHEPMILSSRARSGLWDGNGCKKRSRAEATASILVHSRKTNWRFRFGFLTADTVAGVSRTAAEPKTQHRQPQTP